MESLLTLAGKIAALLKARGATLSVAESLTGELIAASPARDAGLPSPDYKVEIMVVAANKLAAPVWRRKVARRATCAAGVEHKFLIAQEQGVPGRERLFRSP